MGNIVYYTEEGYEKLKEQLKILTSVERSKASQAIAEARDKGDLSENAEYDAAKEAQGLLELKISKLQKVVANVRILDESKMEEDKVLLLSIVKIKNIKNNMIMKYTIVPEEEADLKSAKLSVSSPIAKGLLGKEKGDKVDVQVPAGTITFEIIEVSR